MSKLMAFALTAPIAAAAVAGAALGVTAPATATSAPACEIRARHAQHGVALYGLVTAPSAIAGDYRFTVSKSGPAGTSSSAQSGAFAARAGETEIVGEVMLGLEPSASYEATLEVHWPGGTARCVGSHPNRI